MKMCHRPVSSQRSLLSDLQEGKGHPVVQMVGEMWPVLEATAARHQSSERVFEKLSRFFKHTMRACGLHFESLLKVLHLICRVPRKGHDGKSWLKALGD